MSYVSFLIHFFQQFTKISRAYAEIQVGIPPSGIVDGHQFPFLVHYGAAARPSQDAGIVAHPVFLVGREDTAFHVLRMDSGFHTGQSRTVVIPQHPNLIILISLLIVGKRVCLRNLKDVRVFRHGLLFFVQLDDSQIPGGWGIYRLDMGADGMTPHLETLYSLPEGSLVADFWGDETGYFLLSQEEGQLRLRIFDPSVRLTQTLDLFSLEGLEYQQTWQGEDYFVPMAYGLETSVSTFAVVCRRDGAWQLDFVQGTDALNALDVTYFNWIDDYYSPLYLAYNGHTLAIRDTPSRNGTDFYLALYSKEGLEYLGSYSCSLNPPNRGYGGCDLTVPIQSPLLTWTESGS